MAAATATAEVCNANSHMITSGELRALQPVFRTYGGRKTTYVLVRALLEEKGEGSVLVVDGGGSLRRALLVLGGNIAMLAQTRTTGGPAS
ncbi:putative 4-hydroxy-4-methyl-2-oxoglutarate aldolase 2 [Hordeum vulgare]|nr:putative 4-hydroxy-4-methyl-2-oxoglutarate aldolase 2 [Hordeum vulgare]